MLKTKSCHLKVLLFFFLHKVHDFVFRKMGGNVYKHDSVLKILIDIQPNKPAPPQHWPISFALGRFETKRELLLLLAFENESQLVSSDS